MRLLVLLKSRLRNEERGFALLEVVVAMGVILLSLTMLANTALVGFRGAAVARQRQVATALADKLVEEVRGLPWATVTSGLSDSDLTSDSNIVSCSGTYMYPSCSGETLAHASGLPTAAPFVPHTGSVGSADGFPDTFNWAVYVTKTATSGVYRLTIKITWSAAGGAGAGSLQTQTLLSQVQGSGDSSTQTSGGSTAYFYGDGSVSPGSVVITPNGPVYNGVGVTGLASSVWNTGDSVTQTIYSLDAEVSQGQVVKVDGQSTLTSAQKSISGTATSSGGSSTFSAADDDPTTTDIGTTSAPSSLSQIGPALSVTGGGNSLGLNQYTGCSGTITRRASTSKVAKLSSSILLDTPAGTSSGDVLIAEVGIDSNGTITAPSGWTSIRSDVNGSAVRSSVFYKVAGSSEPSNYTFTTPSGSYIVGGIVAYACVDTTNPVNVSNFGSGTSTSVVAPSVTTTVAKAVLLAFWTGGRDFTSTDSQMAQQWTVASGTGNGLGNNTKVGGGAADQTFASSGATGTKTGIMSASAAWVAQSIALKPAPVGTPGTESGSTVSAIKAQSATPCGTPTQNDLKACAYATQSYIAASQAFLATTADLSGYGIGTCPLYAFNPPTTNPTNYAYGHRAATTGDGKVSEDVKRYYGTSTFAQLCSGTGSTPSSWPGYFVKYDASNSACEATAEAGVSATSPAATTAGTIYVWNGSGTTSFSVPTTGTWSTTPTTVSFTTSTSYHYDISATLASTASYTSSTSASGTTSEAKSVVGAPVVGTIAYKLTDPSNNVLIDVTITIDLGSLTSYTKYTPAA